MNKYEILKIVMLWLLVMGSSPLFAFGSGSTGADGAFNPTSNQVIDMNDHPNGIYNYTSINIPVGVTITFISNTTNTPVIFLAQDDVVIDGTININGESGMTYGLALPGPGGYKGGRGGLPTTSGGSGFGPGGASGAQLGSGGGICGGSGAGYRTVGRIRISSCRNSQTEGPVYGSISLVPLFGGSGGGGGTGGGRSSSDIFGGAGGAGAGALLIASSGTLTLNGSIFAIGGGGQDHSIPGVTSGGGGGGGSGGAVRLLASTLNGNGDINVSGGAGGSNNSSRGGGNGGSGRVRLEADDFSFTGTITPLTAADAVSPAQAVFPANIPTISISTIAGRSVPAQPAGSGDVQFPSDVVNPVTVELAASNVPLASAVEITLRPIFGDAVTATSTPLTGTVANSTATASITLPQGLSVLTASVNFSITIAMGEKFSPFAEGELVASIRLEATPGQGPVTTLITASGKEFTVPSHAVAMQ